MKSVHKDPFKYIKNIKTTIIPGREKTFFFEKRSQLNTNFYPQKKEAPLVVLIADMSGSPFSGYMMYMADIIHAAGFNVLTIPSPLFWNFVVSSSTTAMPGLTRDDAIDMYQALQKVLANVKSQHSYKFTKTSLVGFGFGGLLSGHIADLDQKQKAINFDQFVLINPVVNLNNAIFEIETRTAIALELGMPRVNAIKAKAFNLAFELLDEKNNALDPHYFANLEQKFPLSEKEYKFLSGALMRMYIGDTIFASQLVNDLGILKTKITKFRVNARHAEIEPYGLVGYIKTFFIPFHLKKYKLLEILKYSNLNLVRKTLISNKNIFLFHNADDFLINTEQLDELKEIFEEDRRIIYPKGGHLGNLWFDKNKSDLLQILNRLRN